MSRRRTPSRARRAPARRPARRLASQPNMGFWLVVTIALILLIKYQETH